MFALCEEDGDVAFGAWPGHACGMATGEVRGVFDVGTHHVRLAVDQTAVRRRLGVERSARVNAMGGHGTNHKGDAMRRGWRSIGTGSWLALAAMGMTVVALVGVTRNETRQPPGEALRMAFEEFPPLHGRSAVLVVDVRDTDSFEDGHIPGAVHVPGRDVEVNAASIRAAARGRLVVTYCSCPTEASSLRAAAHLADAGIKARALVGGFPRWVESGGAIER